MNADLQSVFDAFAAAARAGARCPMNGTGLVTPKRTTALARAGYILVEIGNRNWRRVTILKGEHRGKSTLPDPSGSKPWKVIDTVTRINGRVHVPKSDRTPSLAPVVVKETSR